MASNDTKDILEEMYSEIFPDIVAEGNIDEKQIQNLVQASTHLLKIRKELSEYIKIYKETLYGKSDKASVKEAKLNQEKITALLKEEAVYTMVVDHAAKVAINIPSAQRN